jgi:hypothetical protein
MGLSLVDNQDYPVLSVTRPAIIAGDCGGEDRREETMPYQFERFSTGNAGHIGSIPFAAGLGPMLWNPFLGADAEALGAFGTIAREWQDFVGRRVKEDVALVQRLTRCSTPDQALSAYTDFWRKAGEDYANEFNTMANLMTDMADKMAVAQSATAEASARPFQRKAA